MAIKRSPFDLTGRTIVITGAGGLMGLTFVIVGDLVSPRDRGKYQGLFGAVWGVSSVAGPLLGGFFSDNDTILGITGWRWIFYLLVVKWHNNCTQ